MDTAGPSYTDAGQESKFSPGELVLCRFGEYPYTTATIDDNYNCEFPVRERHRCLLATDNGIVPFYWCTFVGEAEGGWVPEDRIASYDPRLVHYCVVPPEHSMYDYQREVLKLTDKVYKCMYANELEKLASVPISPTPDLLMVYKCGGDPNEENDHTTSAPNKKKARTLAPKGESKRKRLDSSRLASKGSVGRRTRKRS